MKKPYYRLICRLYILNIINFVTDNSNDSYKLRIIDINMDNHYQTINGYIQYFNSFLTYISLYFQLFGLAILAIGIWMVMDDNTFLSMRLHKCTPSDNFFTTVPYLFIGIGTFVILVTFLSCCGAFAESTCFLCLVSTIYLIFKIFI